MSISPAFTRSFPDPALARFHPLVQEWFQQHVGEPSEPQRQGWPIIQSGLDVLIAAPTGSGKTLAAFMACLDKLFRQAIEGVLPDITQVLYVSPLKALGNDVQKNLIRPLESLLDLARARGLTPLPIRVAVRTGDTPTSERAGMVKRPPHILITTPESLFLYLTADKSRKTLLQVQTVIVDEIHALARDKRGSHFALSLERLEALTGAPVQRVGLSATQKPLEVLAAFLTGNPRPGREACQQVEIGHQRPWDIRVETPDQALSAVADHEAWGQIYDRLMALVESHRTTLIFANTRKLAERVAHDLGERLGEGKVAAHHGSMARELRLAAEERLKSGDLRVMVATASLELGIDIGSVDLVCQLGSPRSIAVALQRVGRAGHFKGGISKGIFFAFTRDELVEISALLYAIRQGELDAVRLPEKPLDVLAQQIVGACACEPWQEEALFALCRRAYPYRDLSRSDFDKVVQMLSEGPATGRGRARVHLHHDQVNGVLRARKGARLSALTNAGAIPDTFNYPVIAEPEEKVVGSLDEDFAVESMAGDVFLLGSTAWRVQRVTQGTVRVVDAHGQAPTVPFWRGEAPSRTDELSAMVSQLRETLLQRENALEWLQQELRLSDSNATALLAYLRATVAALGKMPSTRCLVAERFFDEAGGMQLIIHSPFGGRINRAWGLALRKRFCRSFDFELQAAASDDAILLSLGEQHSFPLADIFGFLGANNVEDVLTQAVLQAPLFGTRFRWDATRALALARYSGGQKVPPILQRARAEDLLAAVFPAQVGCQDNHGGADIELPDNPLVQEAMRDCLTEALDIEGLKEVLKGMQSGRIATVAVDLPEPSVLAHGILNSQPYTYLDEAPLEERRARAVAVRRTLPPEDAGSLSALDVAAIAQVVADAQPVVRDAEELHDALLQGGWVAEAWVRSWAPDVFPAALEMLLAQNRVTRVRLPGSGWFLVAAERGAWVTAAFGPVTFEPPLPELRASTAVEPEAAIAWAVRGAMEISGPVTVPELARKMGLSASAVEQAMARLESEGQVLRGRFRPVLPAEEALTEWCDRRLLQRIHRLTVGRLRQEIVPCSAQDFMRFLFRWHHLVPTESLRGSGGLRKAVSLLQGYEAPAAAWELALLPYRIRGFVPELLDRECYSGQIAWGRLTERDPQRVSGPRRGVPVDPLMKKPRSSVQGRAASLSFCLRQDLDWLLSAARPGTPLADGPKVPETVSPAAREVALALERRGASFFIELVNATRRLPAEVEDALWELLSGGWVSADAADNLRVLQSPKRRKRQKATQRGGPGRWFLLAATEALSEQERVEKVARLFLTRYGIIWRDLAIREPLCPSWRELLGVYRRLEARGEIRGGRFVSGFAGEQFALPEAVDLSRQVRRQPHTGQPLRIAAVDPLNLTGVVTPGPRVPAMLGNEVVYVDGLPQDLMPQEGFREA